MKHNGKSPVSLAEEIEAMFAKDQEMRNTFQETKQWNSAIDDHNTKRAEEIIAKIGWPTISKVGEKASGHFWFLIQHADSHPDFQRKCLALIKTLPKEEIKKDEIAYLEDRVRCAEGKPQVYGTQFWTNSNTGKYEARPIEDREHVEERRAEMGMRPFTEYEKVMMERFDSE